MRFLRSEDGLTTTEYGLLVALVGVAAAAAVKLAGPLLMAYFQKGATDLQTQIGP
jgi:Flp pilus assembly pilin Flp